MGLSAGCYAHKLSNVLGTLALGVHLHPCSSSGYAYASRTVTPNAS